MSTTSMAIFSNPLFASYSVYAHNASKCPPSRQSRLPDIFPKCIAVVQGIMLCFVIWTTSTEQLSGAF